MTSNEDQIELELEPNLKQKNQKPLQKKSRHIKWGLSKYFNIKVPRKVQRWFVSPFKRSYLLLFVGFLMTFPLNFLQLRTPEASRVLFSVCLMAFYWITGALPLAVTSLFPLALFPLLRILDSDEVAAAYFNDTIFLFVGSFVIAIAMEKWNLHRRIALKVLLWVGNQPRKLLLGFMLITGFLSMWMSNTSTTGVMVPLIMSVIKQIRSANEKLFPKYLSEVGKDDAHNKEESEHIPQDNNETKTEDPGPIEEEANAPPDEDQIVLDQKGMVTPSEKEENNNIISLEESVAEDEDEDDDSSDTEEELNPEYVQKMDYINQYAKGLLIATAWSASILGTSTLQGTGTNLVFKSQIRILYPEAPEISFFQWSAFALPLALVVIFLLWAGFCFYFIKKPEEIHFSLDEFNVLYA